MIRTNFIVSGPFEILNRNQNTMCITKDDVKKFWAGHAQYAGRKGCYIVAIRAGKGVTPVYVGKASRQTFEKEALAGRHRSLYNEYAMQNNYKKGTPILFLVSMPAKRGAVNNTDNSDLEKFLIKQAVSVNPKLKNSQGTKPAKWSIEGVIRGKQGKPSKSAKSLKGMLDL